MHLRHDSSPTASGGANFIDKALQTHDVHLPHLPPAKLNYNLTMVLAGVDKLIGTSQSPGSLSIKRSIRGKLGVPRFAQISAHLALLSREKIGMGEG